MVAKSTLKDFTTQRTGPASTNGGASSLLPQLTQNSEIPSASGGCARLVSARALAHGGTGFIEVDPHLARESRQREIYCVARIRLTADKRIKEAVRSVLRPVKPHPVVLRPVHCVGNPRHEETLRKSVGGHGVPALLHSTDEPLTVRAPGAVVPPLVMPRAAPTAHTSY